jgi:hypothetical protein
LHREDGFEVERGSRHEEDGDGDGVDGGSGSVGAGTGSSNGRGGTGRVTAGSGCECEGACVDPFPPVNLKNFTAPSPTTAEVNAFLKQAWGFDDDRIWSVAAILKTQAPGVARVVVFAADKAHPEKVSRNEFFVTPDGKHAIAGGVVDFGPTPFAERRELMQQSAAGPAEGAASKDLLMVLFLDLLNARSKDAQDVVNNLGEGHSAGADRG